ncbi:hypothetical protein PMAYCL1PPCAC_26995, partial [Pristionchus mayeri]
SCISTRHLDPPPPEYDPIRTAHETSGRRAVPGTPRGRAQRRSDARGKDQESEESQGGTENDQSDAQQWTV